MDKFFKSWIGTSICSTLALIGSTPILTFLLEIGLSFLVGFLIDKLAELYKKYVHEYVKEKIKKAWNWIKSWF